MEHRTEFVMRRFCPLLVAALAVLLVGCGLFGPNEEYRREKGKTIYRSADRTAPGEELTSSAPPKKVPGE
jgi:hypothetical protein